jgi:hypothetical protein
VFGLVDGPFKYIYDFNRDRAELFNLAINPSETHDLSADSAYSAKMMQDGARIWGMDRIPKMRIAQVPDSFNSCCGRIANSWCDHTVRGCGQRLSNFD